MGNLLSISQGYISANIVPVSDRPMCRINRSVRLVMWEQPLLEIAGQLWIYQSHITHIQLIYCNVTPGQETRSTWHFNSCIFELVT